MFSIVVNGCHGDPQRAEQLKHMLNECVLGIVSEEAPSIFVPAELAAGDNILTTISIVTQPDQRLIFLDKHTYESLAEQILQTLYTFFQASRKGDPPDIQLTLSVRELPNTVERFIILETTQRLPAHASRR